MPISIFLLISLLLQCGSSLGAQTQTISTSKINLTPISRPVSDSNLPLFCSKDMADEAFHEESRELDETQDSQIDDAESAGNLQQSFNTILTICVHILTLLDSSSPIAMLSLILMNMTQSLRFLTVNYSDRLQTVYSHRELFTNPIIPQMPRSLIDKFSSDVSPDLLRKYGVSSPFFLVNFWQGIITLTILFSITAVICILEKCTRKSRSKLHKILLRPKRALKWNYFVSLLLCWSGEIIFFSSIEFKTAKFNSAASIISFIFCSLMNLVIFALIFYMIRVLHAVKTTDIQDTVIVDAGRSYDQMTNTFKYREWRVVFARFRENSSYRRGFLLFLAIRVYVFFFVLAYFPNSPIAQTVIFTLMSLFVMLYLTIARPHKKSIEFVECLVQESVVLLLNSLSLGLVILDNSGIEAQATRDLTCSAIIWINTLFVFVVALYMLVKATAVLFIKVISINKKNPKITPVIPLTPDTSVIPRGTNMEQMPNVNDISVMIPITQNLDDTMSASKIPTQSTITRSISLQERPRRNVRVNLATRLAREQAIMATNIERIRQQNRTATVGDNLAVQIMNPNANLMLNQGDGGSNLFEMLKELFHHH